MIQGAPIPHQIAQQAVELLVEWQMSEQPQQARQQIDQWRSQHPDHERAWQHMEQVNQQFEQLSSGPAQQALMQPSNRRQMLKTLALAAFAVGMSIPAWRSDTLQGLLAAPYRTGKGEQGSWTLADGSLLKLNSDSAVRVHFGPGQRDIELLYGEAYVETGHANAQLASHQALTVRTRDGLVTPLGTRFNVHEQQQSIHVQVYQGTVRLQPRYGSASKIEAGWQASFDNASSTTARPLSQPRPAWTQGMIVADNMRLDDFLRELNRHRHGVLQVDPAAANLRVSGTYPIDQADIALDHLASILPVKVQRFTELWIRVLPE